MLQPGFVTMGELNNQPSPILPEMASYSPPRNVGYIFISYPCEDFSRGKRKVDGENPVAKFAPWPRRFPHHGHDELEPIHWRYRFHIFLAYVM